MSSIFTKIINGEIPSYKVAEDENYLAFLDVFPLKPGHVLVIPKKEVDDLFELDAHTYTGLWQFTHKVAAGVKAAIPCKKLGVAVIGLEVPHVHIHLVPLNHVGDLNFSSPKMKISPEELEETAKLISAAIGA